MGESKGPTTGQILAWVLVIAVIAGEVFLLQYTWDSPSESAKREVLRASIQVLLVVFVGALITLAIGSIQKASDERRKLVDGTKAEERRVDERATEFAARMLDAYHGVKRVRRLLEAETGPLPSKDQSQRQLAIHRDAYLRLMSDLCDRQLEFESLKKRARVLQTRIKGAEGITVEPRERKPDRTTRLRDLDSKGSGAWTTTRDSWEAESLSLEKACRAVERHLNELVEEFQKNLHRVPDEATMRLDEIQPPRAKSTSSSASDAEGPMLPVFIFDTDCFRALVTRYVDAARDFLDERLLREAEAPRTSWLRGFLHRRPPVGADGSEH